MSDTFVTLTGWVGGDVAFRSPKDVPVAAFRVGSTPRIRKNGTWEDGETVWYSVSAWRGLAENVRDSVSRGDAVIVHGRLRTRTWSRGPGEPENTVFEIEASLVGHDMSRGTSQFTKRQRVVTNEPSIDDEVAQMLAEAASEEMEAAA